ncbi:MAG: acyl-CoA dehydrogenase family protein [Castellaniella sp.]
MPAQELMDGIDVFVSRELASGAEALDRSGELPDGYWRKMGEFGLTALLVPEAFDGLAADTETYCAALAKVAGACASSAWMLIGHSVVCAAISALGSDAQKSRYLPRLARAELVGGTLAMTETGGGSNPAAVVAQARQEGNTIILDGGKFFITQAGGADVYIVMARMPDTPGLSCLLVEKDDAGLSFGQREHTLGLHGVQVREMHFDQCRLPSDRLLGVAGGGGAIMAVLGSAGVLAAGAAALGMAEAAVQQTRAFLEARIVAGQRLADIPAIRTRMVQMVLELEGARAWLGHGLDWLRNPRPGAPLPLWMAKVSLTRTASRLIDECLGLHGAMGYSQALPLERWWRDARAFQIHWGNNEVLMDGAAQTLFAPRP